MSPSRRGAKRWTSAATCGRSAACFTRCTDRPPSLRRREIADILANVLKSPLDWTRLPADTPSAIRTLLRRCLERDRARRLPDIGSARLEIADAIGAVDEPRRPASPHAQRVDPLDVRRGRRSDRGDRGGDVGAMAIHRTAAPAMRLAIELGTDAEPMTLLGPALALSPDGSTLALLARPSSGQSQLYVRRLNELRAVPLAGTEGASCVLLAGWCLDRIFRQQRAGK